MPASALLRHFRDRSDWTIGDLRRRTFRAEWEGPRRRELLARLDLDRCVPLCRLDALNAWLESAAAPCDHAVFL